MSGMTMFLIAGGVSLLAVGKESPLMLVLGLLKAAASAKAAKATSGPPAPDSPPLAKQDTVKQTTADDRLPSWINDANDLQQMLLFLANHASKKGNVELKDATLELMKPYADLQVAVKETPAAIVES